MSLLQVYRAVKYYYIVESRTVWPNLWRVVNLIHILLILAHWFGCFYFLLSEAEGFQVIAFQIFHLAPIIISFELRKAASHEYKFMDYCFIENKKNAIPSVGTTTHERFAMQMLTFCRCCVFLGRLGLSLPSR